MKFKKWMIGLATLSALAIAGCGNGQSDADTSNQASAEGPAVGIMEEVQNEGEAIDGGTLKVALVTDAPFQGIFSFSLASDAYDTQLMQFSHEELLKTDENFQITDQGPAKVEIDEENKTATLTLRDNLKWSDGEPVTADDVIFGYEVYASPDSQSLHFDLEENGNVEGVEEFHNGEADHISGIEKVDDHTVKYHLKEITPDLKYGGGGLHSEALPKHDLEDIPVEELSSSPQLRQHPIGFGAFRVTQIVDGESVEYEANEYYYGGKPKIDKIQLTRVPSANIASALKNQQYDVVLGMPNSSYEDYKDAAGYDFLTVPAMAYSFMDFKLGKWNDEKRVVEPDPNAKMADPKLRQAMGYAVDNDAVGERFYHGLSWNANSLVVPSFQDLHDSEQKGFYYDPEKAKQLLDEAGYKDTDGDGLREDPEGNKLTINYGMAGGDAVAEPQSQYYMQAWKEVGLDVQLTDGRLLDFNNLSDRIENDDDSIDVFMLAWSVGTNPKPENFSRTSQMNMTRYATEKSEDILAQMSTTKAFEDENYYKELFKEWQQYNVDDPAEIPLRFSVEVTPVNKRVKFFNASNDNTKSTAANWATVELTADAPVAE